MADTNAKFCRDKSGPHRGVDIPINKNDIWSLLQYYWFKPAHDLGRLPRMTTRTDIQVNIRRGDPKFREKDI